MQLGNEGGGESRVRPADASGGDLRLYDRAGEVAEEVPNPVASVEKMRAEDEHAEKDGGDDEGEEGPGLDVEGIVGRGLVAHGGTVEGKRGKGKGEKAGGQRKVFRNFCPLPFYFFLG